MGACFLFSAINFSNNLNSNMNYLTKGIILTKQFITNTLESKNLVISHNNRHKYFSHIIITALFLIAYLFPSNIFSQQVNVTVGAEVLVTDSLHLIKNKKLGIVTNHSAILSNGRHLVDTLTALSNIKITALFGPEHGIRGNAPDGESIKDGIDSKSGLPVYSLYGKIRKPTTEMLKDVDLLLFDIQDIGARFYTFISTLHYILESAAENNIPIIVLDRPNPINGIVVDGPIRTEEFRSFVAIAPIPIQHGMTIGELAIMYNGENWLENGLKADLTVIKMREWKREFYYDDCNLPWLAPSPNIPILETAIIYPGMCLIEGVNVSEGRGTYSPFLKFGAPYIDSNELLNELNTFDHSEVELKSIKFTPKSIPNMSIYPKYKDILCYGIEVEILEREKFNALRFGIETLYSIHKLYPEEFDFRKNYLDKLFGNKNLSAMLKNNSSPDQIFETWKIELDEFKNLRKKYLLY